MSWGELGRLVWRAVRLRCPVCGQAPMFQSWFKRNEVCPRCGWRFMREEGYFTGAMAINLVVTEMVLFALAIGLLVYGLPIPLDIAIGVAAALLISLGGWPYSQSLWVACDLLLHPIDE
jgi:uncharacterized protein (DUF983 family)